MDIEAICQEVENKILHSTNGTNPKVSESKNFVQKIIIAEDQMIN